jgi:hypothetical protein
VKRIGLWKTRFSRCDSREASYKVIHSQARKYESADLGEEAKVAQLVCDERDRGKRKLQHPRGECVKRSENGKGKVEEE